ncbi:hypothetical protein Tco_0349511, partial [Tanacetum coccineum]
VENECGFYESTYGEGGIAYTQLAAKMALSQNISVPWITSDSKLFISNFIPTAAAAVFEVDSRCCRLRSCIVVAQAIGELLFGLKEAEEDVVAPKERWFSMLTYQDHLAHETSPSIVGDIAITTDGLKASFSTFVV